MFKSDSIKLKKAWIQETNQNVRLSVHDLRNGLPGIGSIFALR
jgi:hypothetical protein